MDFRTPRPADNRGSGTRLRPVQRSSEESQPETSKTAYRAAPVDNGTKSKKPKRFIWLIVVVIIVILGVAGWFAWSKMQNAGTAIDSSKYQAVFFANGQVYFGKLHTFNNEYMKLSEIYYLRSSDTKTDESQNPQKTAADQNNVQLIKLGDEIHGPQDEMVISKDQILFYENLKPDGKVTQSIDKFKSSH